MPGRSRTYRVQASDQGPSTVRRRLHSRTGSSSRHWTLLEFSGWSAVAAASTTGLDRAAASLDVALPPTFVCRASTGTIRTTKERRANAGTDISWQGRLMARPTDGPGLVLMAKKRILQTSLSHSTLARQGRGLARTGTQKRIYYSSSHRHRKEVTSLPCFCPFSFFLSLEKNGSVFFLSFFEGGCAVVGPKKKGKKIPKNDCAKLERWKHRREGTRVTGSESASWKTNDTGDRKRAHTHTHTTSLLKHTSAE